MIQIVDANNEGIATYTTSKAVQNGVASAEGITSGEEYSVYTGGTASGDALGGLSTSGELGSATSVATVTAGEAAAGGMGAGDAAPADSAPPSAARTHTTHTATVDSCCRPRSSTGSCGCAARSHSWRSWAGQIQASPAAISALVHQR